MVAARWASAAHAVEDDGRMCEAEQEGGVFNRKAGLLEEHRQLSSLRDRVEGCVNAARGHRARAAERGWAWLASQSLALAEEAVREAERSEEMQRLAERIAADNAEARSEHESRVGCTRAPAEAHDSPLKKRVQVLEQVSVNFRSGYASL